MAEAHYHLSNGSVVIQKDDDFGVNALSNSVHEHMESGNMIVVDGFDDGRIDSVLVNPDHVCKVMFISD